MYTTYNREIQQTDQASTKYTDYLKTLDGPESFDSGGARRVQSLNRRHPQHPLLPISDNEVKFSNIFSPHESNALKLQLLQKASSLPILDTDNARSAAVGDGSVVEAERLISTNNNGNRRRRSTASGVVHGGNNNNNAATRKTDSVANILYSTIRHGHEYDNPSADETLHTGSDSKVDYDPHEPHPSVEIALRHELLNNIRAISRATYFEDLYTGKVRQNVGSPEAEILRALENPQEVAGAIAATTIPSNDASLSRVDRWVKESSEASRVHGPDEEKERPLSVKNGNSSLYHQSVWNEQENVPKAPLHPRKPIKKRNGSETTEGSYTESDVETASAYMQRTKHLHKTKFPPNKAIMTNDANTNPTKTFSKNTDTVSNFIETADKTEIIPGITASTTAQYLHAKYLNRYDTELGSLGKRRPFSFGYNSSDDLIPMSVSLPNVAQAHNRTNPVIVAVPNSYKMHSISRPENLNFSTTSLSTKPPPDRLKKRETNNANNEQVRKMVQPPVAQRGVMRGRPDRKVPGIYSRLNMNQWAVKKVWFYVNGDDHFPRFEYRFRHGKDIRDLDQLLDILTKRIPSLPMGARYIFTMDGYLISSLEEMLNEQSYVVSSIRKFKTLKYGNGGSESDGIPDLTPEPRLYPGRSKALKALEYKNSKKSNRDTHQRLNRKLSASDGDLNSSRLVAHYKNSVGGKKSVISVNSNSVNDVVAHVITEASTSSSLARQPIRVINGARPSLQSQVLLNTKTSQPFDDLVRDLAASVRIPKQPLGNILETLVGRQIRSYSQLRSELRAGQRAFYVFADDTPEKQSVTYKQSISNHANPQRRTNGSQLTVGNASYHRRNLGHKPVVKSMLGKVDSNSSSDLSLITASRQKERSKKPRRRSHSPTPNPRSISRLSDS